MSFVFREKSIEAIQVTRGSIDKIQEFVGNNSVHSWAVWSNGDVKVEIYTNFPSFLEMSYGTVTAETKDYIIKLSDNRFVCMKAEVFEMLFKEAKENDE